MEHSHAVATRSDTLFYIVSGVLTIAMSSALALGGPGKITFFVLGLSVSAFLCLLRIDRLVLITGILVYLVIGQLLYFAGINEALWLAYLLGGLILLRVPSAYVKSPMYQTALGIPLSYPLFFFLFAAILSVIVNQPPLLQAIVGGKNLLVLWSVYLVIALCAIPFGVMEKAIRCLLGLAVIQLPFVLYQYFVVVPNRVTHGSRYVVELDAAWDAIVGSYGGDPYWGGASGTMAYMLVLAVLLAINLRRYKCIGVVLMLGVIAAAVVCIALAEIKIVVLLLPLGLAVLFRRSIVANPLKSVFATTAVLVAVVGLLVLYEKVHYRDSIQHSASVSHMLDNAFSYSLDPTLIDHETGEMGRSAAIIFWWQNGFLEDPIRGFFGYGLGASRSQSTFAVGEIAREYSFGIDRSAATQILWEIGLVGLVSYVCVLLGGVALALQCVTATAAGATAAMLETCAAGLVMALSTVPYGRDILEVPALSFTVMVLLGYAAQAHTLRRIKVEPFNVR